MPPSPSGLPAPVPEARAASERLRAQICAEAGDGPLSFARFMALALYAPGLGYYAGGSRKFGEAGDFVTAPEISPLFAWCLARQSAEILTQLGGGEILEFGAGTGALMIELLRELERLDALPARYLIMEVSAELAERQRTRLLNEAPHLASRVTWLTRLPTDFEGVVIANEVLDALPVQRFRLTGAGVEELGVRCTPDGFAWHAFPAGARLAERVHALVQSCGFGAPYESEVGFAAEDWLRTLADVLQRGVALLVDYGFPAREFYHPQRSTGTLMCHYRHRAHADPFFAVGLQDITAHVDFTAMAEAAHAAGLDVLGFSNQASFLMGAGLMEFLASPLEPRAQLERAAAVHKLTLPSEMGELFKVLAVGRGVDGPLSGFRLRDDRARL
jgi:SAM-dependent MidA family methyltransferase